MSSPFAPGVGPLQPELYYSVTALHPDNDCPNSGQSYNVSPCYSNDGVNVSVVCGLCDAYMTITAAALLDPQPPVS